MLTILSALPPHKNMQLLIRFRDASQLKVIYTKFKIKQLSA